jgi:hypothetical protein
VERRASGVENGWLFSGEGEGGREREEGGSESTVQKGDEEDWTGKMRRRDGEETREAKKRRKSERCQTCPFAFPCCVNAWCFCIAACLIDTSN